MYPILYFWGVALILLSGIGGVTAQTIRTDAVGNAVLSENVTSAYPWTSISTGYSGSGTVIDWSINALGNNAYTDAIPVGFTFNYYGTAYNHIFIMSSGWLSFTDQKFVLPDTSAFPYSSDDCAGVIAPFAITLDNSQADGVYYQTLGTAPRRRLVVEWSDAYTKFNQDYSSFQAVFYEGSNQIEFLYNTLADDGSTSNPEQSHVGIESPNALHGFDLGLYTNYNQAPYLVGGETRFLFGPQFNVSLGVYNGGSLASLRWDGVINAPAATVALYYDDGTDETGTLIVDGLTMGNGGVYSWDVSGLSLGVGVYIYGVMTNGTQRTVHYAPNRLTPGVGIHLYADTKHEVYPIQITPNPSAGMMAFTIPVAAGMTLQITTLAGEPVRVLERSAQGFMWDGRSTTGIKTLPGIYIGTTAAGATCRIMRME